MRKAIVFGLSALLALCLAGCDVTLMAPPTEPVYMETFGTRPPREETEDAASYKEAMAALAEKRYDQAYVMFKNLGDYRESASYAARFTMVEDVLLRTETYENGQLTHTQGYDYDADGKRRGETAIVTGSGKNAMGLQEKWTVYADRRETETYRDGLLISYSVKPILPVEGFRQLHISYRYDAEGALKEDTGHVQVYSQVEGNRSVVHQYNFSGTYTLDGAGRVTEYLRSYSAGASGQLRQTYEYDEAGRVIREEEENTLSSFAEGKADLLQTREYRYDDAGNLAAMTVHTLEAGVETHLETVYTYENGRLVREVSTLAGAEPVTTETVYIYGDYYAYDPEGKE